MSNETICCCGAAIIGGPTWIHKDGGGLWCYEDDDDCRAEPDPDVEVQP